MHCLRRAPASRASLVRWALHPLDRRAALGVDRLPSRLRVVGRRFDRVDRRLSGLELVSVLDHRARLVDPASELLGSWIDGLEVDPTGRPASDRAPESGERDGDSSNEGEPTLHELDATLPAASCPAAAQRGRLDRRKDTWLPTKSC